MLRVQTGTLSVSMMRQSEKLSLTGLRNRLWQGHPSYARNSAMGEAQNELFFTKRVRLRSQMQVSWWLEMQEVSVDLEKRKQSTIYTIETAEKQQS